MPPAGRWMCRRTISTMRIERMEPSAHKKDRVLVFLEGGELLKITQSELLRYGLRPGMELSDSVAAEIKKSAAKSEMKALGAQLTGSRMLSKKQVVEHLTRRGGDRNTAEETAQWLEELGAVDEAAYGQAIVCHYSAAGYGSGRIRQELHRRGVPRELWEGLLSRMPPAEETVERFIRGRCRNKTVDNDLLRKLSAALQRRGFSWQEIAPALRRLEEETQK